MTKLQISYFTIQETVAEEVKGQSLYTPVWLKLSQNP